MVRHASWGVASWWTMVAMPSPRSNSMTPLVFLGAPKRIVKPLPEPLDPTKVKFLGDDYLIYFGATANTTPWRGATWANKKRSKARPVYEPLAAIIYLLWVGATLAFRYQIMINPCLTKVKQRYLRTVPVQEDDPNWGVDQETHCTYSKHHGELVGGLNPSEKY